MKNIYLIIIIFLLGFFLVGCNHQSSSESCSLEQGFSCEFSLITGDLTGTITTILTAIKEKDFLTLSTFISDQGVRFSPYEYIHPTEDVILKSHELISGALLSKTFLRGYYDGSGEPINLTINEYRDKFVYDVDFIHAPEVYHNQKFQRGNSINTIFEVYSGKYIVEYHFPGFDEQYNGMDWRSLYLVLENIQGQRKLIGIIHGQRTI